MSFVPLMPRGRDRIPTVAAWAMGVACIAALANRFRYGVDLSDETFSIALPYRFVLGDKPFVDEISIQQTAGFVLFPFVWLFVKITGGTTGLVLFVRGIHLLFKAIAALSVHAAARRWLQHRPTAIAVSFVPFAFVPHSIPNVGYNVIGMSLLTAGAFLMVAGAAETSHREQKHLFFLAGLAQGLMSCAYPPMAVAALLGAPLVLLCARERRFVALAAFIGGGLAAALIISPALAFGGIAGVRRSLGWGVHSTMSHTSARLQAMLDGLWTGIPDFYPYALVALGLAWLLRSRSLVAIVVPTLTLACALWFRSDRVTTSGAIRTVTYVGAIAPALVLIAKPDAKVWRGVILVTLPAYAAALAAAFTSTQGVDAAALGLVPCLALFALLAARALERASADATLCMLPAATLMFALVTFAYDFVYRDSPMPQLTTLVTTGPFKGIRTTADRAQMFAELKDITRRFDQRGGRILFLWEAPGFYLFSRMKPSAHSVWEAPFGDLDGLLAYWQAYPKGRGIVVRQRGTRPTKADPIVAPPERVVLETPHFIVYADQK